MPSTISALVSSGITVTQTFTGDYVSSADNTITLNGLNASNTYTASTAVPVTKATAFRVTMSGGTGSIDLTALPGATADETIDCTGLKLQAMLIRSLAANANAITVAKGASNGYGLPSAGTTFTVTLSPGQSILFFGNDSAPDVASGARVMDVTGTGSQILEVEIICG